MVERIFLHHPQQEIFREALIATLPQLEIVCWGSDEAFAAGIADAEVLLTSRPPKTHWKRAKRLRYLQSTGAGVDGLLPAPNLPAQVRVANARGIHGEHMAEFALAMMLAFEKRIPLWLEQQRERRWQARGIHMLRGKHVAILGLGAIGSAVATLCGAFGMRVSGTRRGGESVPGVERVVRPEASATLLQEADYVVVLLPLTDATRGFLGPELLDLLPHHAVLVNLARGGIVDEEALALQLRDGRLRGAAIDVFAREPLPKDDPIWQAPNTILTPHISGWTEDYGARVAEIIAENLPRLDRSEPLRNEIDRARGY